MKLTANLTAMESNIRIVRLTYRIYRVVMYTSDGVINNDFCDAYAYKRIYLSNSFSQRKKVLGYTLRQAYEAAMSAEQIAAANKLY